MKTNILLGFLAFLCFGIISAQEKTDVKVETVTKKVTVRDTIVETKVVNEIAKEKTTLKVEDNDQEDQSALITEDKENVNEVVLDEKQVYDKNNALRAANEAKKKAELEASIAAQKAKAAKEREILEQKKKELLAQMEANRQKLEKRPKGMAKLRKDN